MPASISPEPPASDLPTLGLARGSLYLSRELCELYFPGIASVALLQREGGVYLLPLRGAAAGGALLKLRNARGDRVVHAPELLASLGIRESDPERHLAVRWEAEAAGLRILGLAQGNEV